MGLHWEWTMNVRLHLRRMVAGYVNGKSLEVFHQRSVFRLFLWIIMYDGLLTLMLSQGESLVAFADDVTM